jgi:hypothetical protein
LLKLISYVLLAGAILAATTALAGWLAWEAILYLIHHSR